MNSVLLPLLVVPAQTSGGVIGAYILAGAGVLALIFGVVVMKRMRKVIDRLASLNDQIEAVKEERRGLREKARRAEESAQGKRDEIAKLKKDLSGQKKKNARLQDESKKEIQELKAEVSRLSDELKERIDGKAVEPEDAPSVATPEPKAAAPAISGPTPKEIEALESKNASLATTLKAKEAVVREAKDEVRKAQRRVDGFRRVDLVSKGQIESLEEQLKHLGKQYYDAVSELAAIKGEIPGQPSTAGAQA